MSLSSPALRRFVRRALVAATGAATPTASELAAAFDLLCERLRARLYPLFGAAAISALFARAHHVATAEFTWLRDVVPNDGERCSIEGLQAVAGELDSETLQEGLAAVLAHDLGLLSTFIGEDFVMPLVQEAWGAASVAEGSDNTEKR